MKNPVILFADGYELMDSLNEHLSKSGIKTFCAKENISIGTIKDLNSQGCTVIGYLYNNIYLKQELGNIPLVTVGTSQIPGFYDIEPTNLQNIIDYVEPYYFDYEDMLKHFATCAIEASKAILKIYKKDFVVSYKEDSSPVTEADRASNSIISNYLMETYPDYAILAEETYDSKTIEERVKNPYCLIIDPLDGTKEFIKKNDEFSINIALSYKKRAVCGLIFIPVFNKVYYAARGHGTFKSTSEEFFENIFDANRRISVSNRTDRLICMHSKSSFDDKTKKLLAENIHKIEKLVSKGSAIKMCRIAEGKADVYYRYGHTMEWDTAAGQIIIEEAGGIMRQLNLNQSELFYNRYDSCNRHGFYVINNINSRLI